MPRRVDDSRQTMWVCPSCERTFANRNQAHSCNRLVSLDEHFLSCAPHVRKTFDQVLGLLAEVDPPVSVLPEKSRIAFHVRMSFAAFVPRKSWLDGHLVLARSIAHPRWTRVEEFSPRNILHGFRLHTPDEVDANYAGWLMEAYEVGCQRHR
ncbi:MAG TPA: DUF5655 domain-containing protein [Acidimicrobiia bacterium]|nr:DUF5655 domain-containing protein [Acidimicrobiia bacterium]